MALHRLVFVLAVTVTSLIPMTSSSVVHNGTYSKYLVLGAGVAGLSAVKHLSERGETSFRILEGSERIGGRVKQMQIGGNTVEVGPQWLHEQGEDDPIYDLARRAGIETHPSDLEDVRVIDESGTDVTDSVTNRWNAFYSALGEFDNIGYRLEKDSPETPDISQRAALGLGGWRPESGTDYAIEYLDMDFNYGQPPEAGSTRFSYIPTFGKQEETLVVDQRNGLSKIVSTLVGDIEGFVPEDPRLVLNSRVRSITYSDHSVLVSTTDGRSYTSDYVIVTFSLGVLKSGGVVFDPPLPEWKTYAIAGSTYVTDFPIYLKFPSDSPRFWSDSEFTLFGSSRRGFYTMWQNFEKIWEDSRILQVQLSGTEAERIARLEPDSAIQAEIMTVLRTMYGRNIPEPEHIIVPRWTTDPLFLGAYSDWAPSFPASSHDALRAAVGPVYFAGEAYDRNWFGYLQGAYISGRDTVDGILACSRDESRCTDYTPPYEARGCTYKAADNYDPRAQVDDGSCDITTHSPVSHVSPLTSLPIVLAIALLQTFLCVL